MSQDTGGTAQQDRPGRTPAPGPYATGPHPSGPFPGGPRPTGPIAPGPFRTGPSPTGQFPSGPSPTGQFPAGPFPTGQFAAGPGHAPRPGIPAQGVPAHPGTGWTPLEDDDDPRPAGNPAAAASVVLGVLALLVSLRPLAFGSMSLSWDTYVALGIGVLGLVVGIAGARRPVRRPVAAAGMLLSLAALLVVAVLPTF